MQQQLSGDRAAAEPNVNGVATLLSANAKKNFTLIYHWQKTKTFLSVTLC